MSIRLFAMILSAGACLYAGAGVFPSDPRCLPVLISSPAGVGSGCYVQLSNSVYLITAKHVLFAPQTGTNPPTLLSSVAVARSYSTIGSTNSSSRDVLLNLAALMSSNEIRWSSNKDVALVRIESCLTTNLSVVQPLPGVMFQGPQTGLNVNDSSFLCPLSDIEVGSEVFMFGYPVSLTGPLAQVFDPVEPLLRKGIVAGVSREHCKVIIDCPSYFGNSGGPVVVVEHLSPLITKFRVIGLVSGFIPFQEEWENKTMHYSHVLKSNSGYTVVEPVDEVLNLAWK